MTSEPFSGPDVIERIDERIAAEPDAVHLRFARACALQDLCRNTEAERGFLDVLAREPSHFGALTNLGSLLHIAGRRDVARALFTKAAVEHPHEPIGCINLGNALVEDGEIDAAIATYERAFTLSPGYPNAHFALSLLYRGLGRDDEALRHHQLAFARPTIHVAPALGTTTPIDVLLLVAANGGNVVHAPLLDRSAVRIYRLVVEGYRDDAPLPAHHVVFNAVGDADRAAPALAVAERVVERSGSPCINRPSAVAATGRVAISERLAALPGVVTARTMLLPRAQVTAAGLAAAGFAFPLLLRAPGYHTGQHFDFVATPDDLPERAAAMPTKDVLTIGYLDGRGRDGNYRKYRMLFIGGERYPLHLAISQQWKVHYFSADMEISDAHRAEERAFLADPRGAIGDAALATIARIQDELGLDYGGIDFGLDAAGNVLVYEANATMAVFPAPPDPRFDYRRPAIARVLDAVHALVRARGIAGGYVEA